MALVTRQFIISGKVQGVSYRDWTVQQAQQLALNGWVRNRNDGTVEVLVSGEEAAVQDFVTRCHAGPSRANVEAITERAVDEAVSFSGFERRSTV